MVWIKINVYLGLFYEFRLMEWSHMTRNGYSSSFWHLYTQSHCLLSDWYHQDLHCLHITMTTHQHPFLQSQTHRIWETDVKTSDRSLWVAMFRSIGVSAGAAVFRDPADNCSVAEAFLTDRVKEDHQHDAEESLTGVEIVKSSVIDITYHHLLVPVSMDYIFSHFPGSKIVNLSWLNFQLQPITISSQSCYRQLSC